MKLLREEIEDFEVLTESTNSGSKNYYIQGPFMQWGIPNRNGRLYPEDVMKSAVGKYIEELVSKNRAVGTLGHEDSPKISENKISHIISELRFEGNDVWGKAKVLETASGKELKALIEGGVSFGCSSRALGSLVQTKEGYSLVQDDLKLATAADIVADPSAPGAFVNGIMENKEWMFVEGHFVEKDFDYAKKQIMKASKSQIESVALKLFENYLRKL